MLIVCISFAGFTHKAMWEDSMSLDWVKTICEALGAEVEILEYIPNPPRHI